MVTRIIPYLQSISPAARQTGSIRILLLIGNPSGHSGAENIIITVVFQKARRFQIMLAVHGIAVDPRRAAIDVVDQPVRVPGLARGQIEIIVIRIQFVNVNEPVYRLR